MLKEFLQQRDISIYKLAKISRVPYSTLNDMVNHKVDVEQIRSGVLFRLAQAVGISMDELYEMCAAPQIVFSEKHGVRGEVFVRNKTYFLLFEYHNKKYREELYPVKKEATMFIDTIAVWQMEERIADIEMEEAYAACFEV